MPTLSVVSAYIKLVSSSTPSSFCNRFYWEEDCAICSGLSNIQLSEEVQPPSCFASRPSVVVSPPVLLCQKDKLEARGEETHHVCPRCVKFFYFWFTVQLRREATVPAIPLSQCSYPNLQRWPRESWTPRAGADGAGRCTMKSTEWWRLVLKASE